VGKGLKLYKKCSLLVLFIFLILSLFETYLVSSLALKNFASSSPYISFGESNKAIFVPDDFDTIQEAINAASDGDVIIVRDGVYVENVDVSKSVSIISENGPNSTIVVAKDPYYDVFNIYSSNVNLIGFTIKGANKSAGIQLSFWNTNCTISGNIIIDNYYGIYIFFGSANNTICNNFIANNSWGIVLESETGSNHIFNNIIKGNLYGIKLTESSWNEIYLNCFVNDENVFSESSTNLWHSPNKINYFYEGRNFTNFLGNFWSDYDGDDANNDGIGDKPYNVSEVDADYYPLIGIWKNKTILFVDIVPPIITEIIVSPEPPKPNKDIHIVAMIVDKRSGVKKAILYYCINEGEWLRVEMIEKNGYWIATIPGQPGGSFVRFFIEAVDNEGNVGRSPTKYYQIPGFPTVNAIIAIVMFSITFLALSLIGKLRGRWEEEEFTESQEIILARGDEGVLEIPPLPTSEERKVVKPVELGEEEKRILFELESEKMALEDLIEDLNRKLNEGKIDFLEYSKLYKEYRKELYLVEEKLIEFKLKTGLLESFRCMVCGLEIRSGEDVVFCPHCKSPAHREHLLEWLHIKGICPNCRRFIRKEDLL